MANVPSDLKYTKDHEWARVSGNRATIGLTDFAQRQLGDVVFVQLPTLNDKLSAGDAFGSVESVKAVSEVYMPVSGSIIEINDSVNEDPENINTDPYGAGWLVAIQLSDPAEVAQLLTAAQYEAYIAEAE
jgi:glycine cleavage system H protein